MKSNVIPLNPNGIERKIREVSATVAAHQAPSFENLRFLKGYQLAMIAARTRTTGRGGRHPNSAITSHWLSEVLGVDATASSHACMVLAQGTPKEIEAVDAGEISPTTLAKQIARGMDVRERAEFRATPRSLRGGNARALAQRRFESELWGRLRTALENLTGMPRPVDVARLLKDRKLHMVINTVDQKLLMAQSWLE